MADEEEEPTEEGTEEGAEPKSKGPLKLLVGVVALIATGAILAMMAVPSKEKLPVFAGPSMHTFFADKVVGNPLDDNYSRYLSFEPSCSFLAYDLAYPESRRIDPHYETWLRESFQAALARYRIADIMSGSTPGEENSRPEFAAELEALAEPILFPVHLGETAAPYDPDPSSGLRLGDSQDRDGTFRGAFWEHVLHVDAKAMTLQIGEGPVAEFSEGDYDVLVEAEDGTKIYVDTSELQEGFEGDVQVGVMGRIRRMFTGGFTAQ
ncbi:MAG: hypothetical protein AAFU73_00090 [Planctomycetota bacterium]